jgi:hypothetical protein
MACLLRRERKENKKSSVSPGTTEESAVCAITVKMIAKNEKKKKDKQWLRSDSIIEEHTQTQISSFALRTRNTTND